MKTETIKEIKAFLFDVCLDEKNDSFLVEKFFDELQSRGIRKNDPRIATVLQEMENHEKIDKETFSK